MASNLDLIYERWRASIRDKKGSEHINSNFDSLFDELNAAGASFDDAHAILPQAIKAHLPPVAVAKNYWKSHAKNDPKNTGLTEKDFIDQWNKDIADRATNSFYNVFPVPTEQDDDGEPKVFGSMSAKEYKMQRRHADSYPILDTEELERRMQSGAYNPADDLMDKDKDGKSN